MTPNEQTAVEALVKEVELMCAYSNAVSMALRSPGGRTHTWTLGKISHLYDQQCKVEASLKNIALLEASPTVPVSKKDFEREADKLGFDLDNNMRGEYLDSHTAKTWKLVRALLLSNEAPQ